MQHVMVNNPLLFSTQPYQYLGDKIGAAVDLEAGIVEVRNFPDGERYQRIVTTVSERNVVLLGGTHSDAATLELYDLACSMVKHGAASLTLMVPYFAYSTMERSVRSGEVVTAKARARLLSSIPTAAKSNRIVLMDLHAAGITYYFEGNVVPLQLYAKPVILETCRRWGGEQFVLASTDAGRAKWVESLANELGVDAAFVFKRRIDGRKTELRAMSASVKGSTVIIYDDMIRTGGSLLNAARAYLDAGAARICAIATHGVLPEDALQRLMASNLFEQIAVTDTHPRTQAIAHPQVEVLSVSGIFADWIQTHII